ncbi:MAG: class I SAM-dependent methyltransferase [Polyangiales bacterium]
MPSTEALLVTLFQNAWGSSFNDLLSPLEGAPPALLSWEDANGPASARGAEAAVLIALERWLWARNQFVALDAGDEARLAEAVRRALEGMAQPGGAEAALALHRREVADFVCGVLGTAPREVPCAEYTPALQLEVLGLTGVPLAPPLLDIGCGAGAQLVRFFRDGGLDAEGLDRDAPADVGTRGDWLAHDYARKSWGTVLSHQGFSLHFLHHHHGSGDTAYAYARTYMSILRTLAPGGLFAYAPGLPFLEALLDPSLYRMKRVPFADALRVSSLRAIEQKSGLDLSYAAHVERVG